MTYEDARLIFHGILLATYAAESPEFGGIICGCVGQSLRPSHPEIDFEKVFREENTQMKRKFDAKNKAQNDPAN